MLNLKAVYTPKIANKHLLFNGRFLLLWLGQAISQIGDGLNRVALLWFVYLLTGSASKMAIIGVLQAIPAIALGLIAGAYLDRHSKKRTMILSDLIRFALMILIPTLHYLHLLSFLTLCVCVFIISVVSTFFGPALTTSIPLLVEKERLREANSILQTAAYMGVLLGPSVAGLFIPILGAPNVLYIDAMTFFISAVCIIPIRIKEPFDQVARNANMKQAINDIKEGVRFVFLDNKVILTVIMIALVSNFSLTPIPLLFSVFSEKVLWSGPRAMGYLLSALGLGALGTSLVLASIKKNFKESLMIGLALGMVGMIFLVMTKLHSLPPVLILSILIGSCTTIINIFFVTTIQIQSPVNMLGRVFTTFSTTTQIATPIGLMTAGILLDSLGIVRTLISFGLFMLGTSLIILMMKPLGKLKAR